MPARKNPSNPPDDLTSEVTPPETQESVAQEISEPNSVTSVPETEAASDDDNMENNPAGNIEITELEFEDESEFSDNASEGDSLENELVISDEDEIIEDSDVMEELANEQTDDTIENDETEDVEEEYWTSQPGNNTSSFDEPPRSRQERIADSVHRNKRMVNTTVNRGRAEFSIGLHQKINELYRYRKSKKVLEGIVSKVMKMRSNDLESVCVALFVHGYEEFKFIIPFESFDFYLRSGQTIKSTTDKITMLRRIVGAKIHFIVTQIFPDIKTCIADRQTANKILRGMYYYKGFHLRGDLPNSPKRYIYKGTITTANVIQVSSFSLVAESFGAQYVIPIKEISYASIPTLYKDYHSGDSLTVRLTSVELSNDGSNYGVSVTASHKATIPDIPREELERAKIGDVVLANVTYINFEKQEPRGITFDGYNFTAKIVRHNLNLRIGSLVAVKVTGKVFDDGSSYATVDIIDVKKF